MMRSRAHQYLCHRCRACVDPPHSPLPGKMCPGSCIYTWWLDRVGVGFAPAPAAGAQERPRMAEGRAIITHRLIGHAIIMMSRPSTPTAAPRCKRRVDAVVRAARPPWRRVHHQPFPYDGHMGRRTHHHQGVHGVYLHPPSAPAPHRLSRCAASPATTCPHVCAAVPPRSPAAEGKPAAGQVEFSGKAEFATMEGERAQGQRQ